MSQTAPQSRSTAPLNPLQVLLCASGCGNAVKGKSQYCSAKCKTKAWHQKNFIRRPVKRRPLLTPELATFRLAAQWLGKQL